MHVSRDDFISLIVTGTFNIMKSQQSTQANFDNFFFFYSHISPHSPTGMAGDKFVKECL